MPKPPDLPPPLTDWPGMADLAFTPIPDNFFDVLLPILSDAELRVLLYLMRRTYGFKKTADRVSLSQLVGGIVTRDGARLDSGCGLGKTATVAGVARLEARGVIIAERITTAAHGHEPTMYRLRKAGETLVHETNKATLTLVHQPDKPLPATSPSLVPVVNTQETVVQETAYKNGSIPPPYSGILVLAAQDHAQAFNLRGDVIGRVLRAWAASGQPDQTFLEEVLSPAGYAARKARGDKAGAYWRVVEQS